MTRSEKNQRNKAWDYAVGIVKVDGLEPTPEFLRLMEKEKKGEITTDGILKQLNARYLPKKISKTHVRSLSLPK